MTTYPQRSWSAGDTRDAWAVPEAAVEDLDTGPNPQRLSDVLAELTFQKYALDQHADVTVADAEGRIIYANDHFCQVSGYSREELIGQDHRVLKSGVHGEDFYQAMYATIQRGETWRGQVCNRAKNGALYWVSTTIVPFRGPAGHIERYVAIRTDISACKESESKLTEANRLLEMKNRELDEFASMASHDLNAPLRKLTAFSEMLAADLGTDLSEEAAEDLEAIAQAAQQMQALVEKLSALARAGNSGFIRGTVALADSARAAQQSLSLQIEAAQAKITQVELPTISGDRTLITQLYQNLIGNALKYRRADVPARIWLTAERKGDDWVLGVRDNGIGIQPEHHRDIFAAFKRLHGQDEYEGAGLGLAICARIVERHGGRIWVESTPGQGAHFRFTLASRAELAAVLPVARPAAAPGAHGGGCPRVERANRGTSTRHEHGAAGTARTERVMVLAIDDDAQDAEILRRNLAQVGEFAFEFAHVSTADAAFTSLASGSPDIVFLDYRLGGASGLDVLQEVRKSGFRGPVIMVTGYGDQHVVADLIRAGADDYVPKGDLCPFLLQRAIGNALRLHWRRVMERKNRELVSELQEAQAQLVQKNRRLAELYELAHRFVADVSHDFRTPLTVIKEFAEILLEGLAGELNEQQHEYVGYISERANDLSVMVTDLLDLSHNDAGLLRVVRAERSPKEMLQRTLQALGRKAAAANVRLELEAPEELPQAYCDAEQIGRVLINLAVNALKYSPPGGCVRVWVRRDENPALLRMGVTDQGPGIAPEDQATLFERFRQVASDGGTIRQGFGLGLSIARELVALNLGRIGVDSQIGKGSTFWFTLPTASPESVARQFLDRLEQRGPGQSATLLEVWTNEHLEPRLAGELEVFLQNTLRCRDVPWQIGPGRWRVMAGIPAGEVLVLTDRLESARQEANRNRLSDPLPVLHFSITQVWRSGESIEPFVVQVMAAT